MKSSPYENNPYTSDLPPAEPRPPLPPAPALPTGGRELALALVLAVLSLLTANSLLYSGLRLGCALGICGIFTVTAVYLLLRVRRVSWYPLACLAAGLILTASLARSSDDFVKFFLLLLAMTAYLLGLSQTVWASSYPAGRLISLAGAGRALLAEPYPQIVPALRGLFTKQTPDGPQRRRVGGVLLGLLLSIPALILIVPLLIRSDAAFEGLMGKTILADASELIVTVLFGFLLFLPVYARPVALAQDQGPEPRPAPAGGFSPVTLNTFLAAVSFFYLLYLASQLAYFFSAFGGILPRGFTPAEYARRGFFEMAALCGINLLIVLVSLCRIRRDPNVPVLTRVLCLFILLFSLVLSACAASKMSLYIGAFGLTRLRVLTSLFMLCVAVALVCVAVWILAPRFPYMKIAVLAALLVGCWTGWMDVDTQIARYNVNAYLSGRLDTVDVAHLAGLSDGAVPQLARLLKAEDPQIRAQAREVLADRVLEYYYVTEQNGAVTLQAREEPRLRGWTWTQAQALPLLESLAPELQDELLD